MWHGANKLMESSTLVSVILPTYNRAKLLPRAIKSVLAQTYTNWELIVWDDGSTDNTREIINSYNDVRLKYYYDKNHGVSYARNRAINISQGKYLAFLDSDDQWVDEKLSTQVEVMNSHPHIDVLFTDFLNIDIAKKTKYLVFERYLSAMKLLDVERIDDGLFIIKDGFLESLAVENFIATDSVILRRELLERTGCFTEGLRNFEDFELWWRMGLSGVCFAYLSKFYVTRYKPSGSLSSAGILTRENNIMGLDICLQGTLEKGRIDLVPCLKRLYRNAWQNQIPLYGGNGDRKGMLNAFFQTFRYGFNLGSFRLLFVAIISGKKQRIE